jgi:hypothetical protein
MNSTVSSITDRFSSMNEKKKPKQGIPVLACVVREPVTWTEQVWPSVIDHQPSTIVCLLRYGLLMVVLHHVLDFFIPLFLQGLHLFAFLFGSKTIVVPDGIDPVGVV